MHGYRASGGYTTSIVHVRSLAMTESGFVHLRLYRCEDMWLCTVDFESAANGGRGGYMRLGLEASRGAARPPAHQGHPGA